MKAPLFMRRVVGHSMHPTLKPKQVVFASSLLKPKHRSIVIADHEDKQVVKRLHVSNGVYFLKGDNANDSLDSEVNPNQIVGRVFATL